MSRRKAEEAAEAKAALEAWGEEGGGEVGFRVWGDV